MVLDVQNCIIIFFTKIILPNHLYIYSWFLPIDHFEIIDLMLHANSNRQHMHTLHYHYSLNDNDNLFKFYDPVNPRRMLIHWSETKFYLLNWMVQQSQNNRNYKVPNISIK